jgi:hypothetical protein
MLNAGILREKPVGGQLQGRRWIVQSSSLYQRKSAAHLLLQLGHAFSHCANKFSLVESQALCV